MHEIRITAGRVSIRALLHETPTVREILKILPVRGITQLWGEEIYFTIPLEADLEPRAGQDVKVGELGYWPEGPAFCIFFGPTPVSTGTEPKAYSPVNIIDRVTGDPSAFKDITAGADIVVEDLGESPGKKEHMQR
jgi:uncharacterized protein